MPFPTKYLLSPTNPVEGGDPTGGNGNGNTPNPFRNSGAQSKGQPSWLTSEE